MNLEDLGLPEKALRDFSRAISMPQGIILVTGPTGSGKSSTLYACLNRLNTPDVNIITVEDPVEFDIDGINQVQINPRAGGFEACLARQTGSDYYRLPYAADGRHSTDKEAKISAHHALYPYHHAYSKG
ncbi:MAG: Flp pilus assembly complex ATPase component TadA [Deltaproteobacteria bacterium]|nr:Flp pilus assembly complex ATPase component TadA [Deltaproteobacteria bacterium]MBW2299727.1 Flp pilus assembly complex ATPase component TadA [Deltaproteobacteria bacterium]